MYFIIIHDWWDNVCLYGPLFGYFPEPTKSWLIVKENYKTKAEEIFSDTNIKITTFEICEEARRKMGG